MYHPDFAIDGDEQFTGGSYQTLSFVMDGKQRIKADNNPDRRPSLDFVIDSDLPHRCTSYNETFSYHVQFDRLDGRGIKPHRFRDCQAGNYVTAVSRLKYDLLITTPGIKINILTTKGRCHESVTGGYFYCDG